MLDCYPKNVLCSPKKDDLKALPYEMDGMDGMHGMHSMHCMDCMHDLDCAHDMYEHRVYFSSASYHFTQHRY